MQRVVLLELIRIFFKDFKGDLPLDIYTKTN